MTNIETKIAEAEANLKERLDLLGHMAILLKVLKGLLVMAEEEGHHSHPDVVVARDLVAKVEGVTLHVVPREPAKP